MMTSRPRPAVQPATQRGFLLIEILVSLVIIAFGLLALAGFVTKATTLAVDTVQRTRASTLLSDMAGRLITNKQLAVAGNYVAATQPATGYGTPSATSTVCAGVGVAAVDLCSWHNLLLGTNDAQAGGNAAALGYRGCLSRDPVAPIFTITVAWGGTTPGEPDTVPNSDCGEGQFGDDAYRRVLRTTVRIPSLAE